MKFLLFLSCISFGFIVWAYVVGSIRNTHKFSEDNVENTRNSEVRDSVSPSEKDGNKKDKVDFNLKQFYHLGDTICESSNNKYENLVKTLDNYIQRYISLFLITSNLLDYKIKDLTEDITIDLEITISGKDLAYLQGYSKAGRESTYPKNLSTLDAIFSKIARLKEQTYMENAFRYSGSVFTNLILKLFDHPSFKHYLPLIIIFLVILFSYNFLLYKPYVCIGIIINSMIIWDSFNLYWKRIKEVDIDIYVRALQFKQVPEDCDPSKISWYQRLYSLVIQNSCLQYYQNISKNPIEEVSILKCILDTYSFYLIQTPVKILGTSIKDFTGEVCDLWPWPFNYFVSVPLALFFVVITGFSILILCGKRLRLSFLSASLELGDVKPSIERPAAALPSDSLSKDVRDVRKLRPWTKVRFAKRLDRDFGVRRKLLLKTVKSCEISGNVIKGALDFNERLNSQDSNVKPNDNIIKQD